MDPSFSHSQRRPPPLDTNALRSAKGPAVRHSMDARMASSESKPRSRRPSFRRAISIIAEPTHRQSISSPTSPAPTSKPPRKSWAHPRQSASRQSTPLPEEPAAPVQYYQDPETRQRLKEYFGSPEKFDAALANGFSAAGPASTLDRDTTPGLTSGAYAGNNDAQRFLRSNVISWLDLDDHDDDEDADGDSDGASDEAASDDGHDLGEFDINDYLDDPAERSSFEVYSPITPRNVDLGVLVRPKSARGTPHPLPSASIPTSPQRATGPTADWPRSKQCFDRPSSYTTTPVSPSSQNFPTLRMTLTRPELRAPDEKIYGPSRARSDSHPWPPARSGSDPWDLPPLEEEPAEESKAQRARSRSLWKKMSIGGIKRQN